MGLKCEDNLVERSYDDDPNIVKDVGQRQDGKKRDEGMLKMKFR